MAAGDRSDKLLGRVRSWSGILDNQKVNDTLIFNTLDDIQHEIARDAFCIETFNDAVAVTAGVMTEPTGFLRLKQVVLPTGKTLQPEEIDVTEYDALTRATASGIAQTPQYYFRWNGTIKFYPSPGTTTYDTYYYAIPTTVISTSVDPEIPAIFDRALVWGALSILAPVGGTKADYFIAKYEQEKRRAIEAWRGTKTKSLSIYYSDF